LLTTLVANYGWRRILYTASVLGITLFVVIIVRMNKRRPGPSNAQRGGTASSTGEVQPLQRRSIPRVTISAAEVLLPRVDNSMIFEFLPTARDAFVELCRSNDVYLVVTVSDELTHVPAVRKLLEESGLHEAGLLDRRKVLFCSTNKGRESIARQIEPAVHVDSDPVIVGALQPHLKSCWLVSADGGGRRVSGNVTTAQSLHHCMHE